MRFTSQEWCASCGQDRIAHIHASRQCEFTERKTWAEDATKEAAIATARAAIAEVERPAITPPAVDERCANDHCDRGAGHTGPHDARPVEVAEPLDDDNPEARPTVAELGSGCAA